MVDHTVRITKILNTKRELDIGHEHRLNGANLITSIPSVCSFTFQTAYTEIERGVQSRPEIVSLDHMRDPSTGLVVI